ncbi:MAG: energy transducer TonB [Pseudomonadota bacterium]|nr:energy transducer TonB [Pseudomonadota bacterium]
MTDDAGTRWIALVGAASLHIAVGLALLSAATSGVPLRGKADKASGKPIVVNLVPFDRSGEVERTVEAVGIGLGSKETDRPAQDQNQGGLAPAITTQVNGASDAQNGPVPTTAMAASATANLPNAEVLAYRTRLEAHLARYRAYPAAARRAGQQGVVVLRLHMNRSGQVIDAWVEESSGIAAIDDEAVAAATRAQPLPAFPAGWPERMSIAIPVIFRLG